MPVAFLLLFLMSAFCCAAGVAQISTISGEFWIQPPTLIALGFDWRISGDDNRNAKVEVSYRKKGDQKWREALPLLRLQQEQVGAPTGPGYPSQPVSDGTAYVNPFKYTVPNMFSGSILNLLPDTEYQCRFILSDPDGVKGLTRKVVAVRTRRDPQPAQGGQVYHVYPFGYQGVKQQPSFIGLLAANGNWCQVTITPIWLKLMPAETF